MLGALLGRPRGGRRRGGRKGGGALASAAADWAGRQLVAHKRDEDLEEDDVEAPLPRQRRRVCEPVHGMRAPWRRGGHGGEEATEAEGVEGVLLEEGGEADREEESRHKGRRGQRTEERSGSRRTDEEKRVQKEIEKQQQEADALASVQKKRHQDYAKRQILKSKSSMELLEHAENLIDEDWLGDIDALEGNVYSIGAFGALNIPAAELGQCSWSGIKSTSRLFGCCVIAAVQILGPPSVLCSDLLSLYTQGKEKWDPTSPANSLTDWRVRGPTKLLGTLLLFLFLMNGLFVVVECKETWFKLYNTFRYLKRSAEFEVKGLHFLYLGAFIDCWTVLLCCGACYIVVGTSPSVQDVLFDSLTLLFLYNLDEVGGDLGFVEEDDWPGARLGWIFKHMVKVDWQPDEEESEKRKSLKALKKEAKDSLPCKMGCGRKRKGGYDTCCRACALGKAPPHDPDCGGHDVDKEDAGSGAEDEGEPGATDKLLKGSVSYSGGEKKDWTAGGYIVLAWYTMTVYLLVVMALVLPILEIYTPFSLMDVDG